MIHDMERNLLFIASGEGEVFILNTLPSTPDLIVTVTTDKKACIRGLTRSINTMEFWPQKNVNMRGSITSNYLMASDVNGYITIFDIGYPGKEYGTKRIGNTEGKPK